MLGLMQNHPLLISSLIDFAERHHGEGEGQRGTESVHGEQRGLIHRTADAGRGHPYLDSAHRQTSFDPFGPLGVLVCPMSA